MTQTVGIIGLGNMGGRIAARIAAAGHPVVGYDAAPGRAIDGVTRAGSIAEVIRADGPVLLSLPDSTVVEAVVEGAGGVLESGAAGLVVVDLGTSAPRSTVRLHGRLAERGIELVDAGISGGAAAAEKGTLTIMAGGAPETVAGLDWLFAPFAAKVFHVGPVGAGHTVKLLNNFLNASSLAATAEVMVAARVAGLDLATVLDVFNNGSAVNFATLNRFPRIIEGDYLEGGLTSRLMLKDVQLYLERVAELGVPSLNAAGPVAAFGLANQLGYQDQISNRVVDALGDLVGGVRLCAPSPEEAQA